LLNKALRLVALIFMACVAVPAQAFAHLKLESSSPSQGDTVRTSLTEVRIIFTQAVEPRYTTVSLLDNMGNALNLGVLEPVGDGKTREFVYKLEHPLVSGDFVVQWKTAGDDGHVVNGSFDFTVDVPNAVTDLSPPVRSRPTPPGVSEDVHAGHGPTSTQTEPLFEPTSVPWVLTRWINFIGLMLMVGVIALRFVVLRRLERVYAADVSLAIDNAIRTFALVAALIALAGNLGRFYLQTGALHGSDRMWQPDLLSAMLTRTGWGKAWLAQTFAAIAFAVATRLRTENPQESWIAAAVFAIAAAATPAFAGHAAAVEQMSAVPIFNDAVHVIAAAAWLGSLTVLLLAAVPAIVRSSSAPFADTAALVRTFSPLALFAAAVAIATGTMSAFVHIKAISELWTTPYGTTLSIKLAVVMLTATTGAYNWKVVSPQLGSESATLHVRRSALAEIIIAATIVAVTAVLVALPLH
jgi:putative copper export protein/methionine-rich copper-binding protein CopC